jgi:hypothetical protein
VAAALGTADGEAAALEQAAANAATKTRAVTPFRVRIVVFLLLMSVPGRSVPVEVARNAEATPGGGRRRFGALTGAEGGGRTAADGPVFGCRSCSAVVQ